jgi:hypothetical protein
MKFFYTWTAVLVVALLAAAMIALAVVQTTNRQRPTALVSAAGLAVIALVLARRVIRRGR